MLVDQDIVECIRQKQFNSVVFSTNRTVSGSFVQQDNHGDSLPFFEKNLEKQSEDWYYRHNKVFYDLNSNNYRTKEFKDIDWNNSIVVFGCSNVFGVGLEEKNTITSKIEAKIGIPTINMGIGGSSNLCALNDSLILAENNFIPKAVVFVWSDYFRTAIYRRNNVQNIGSWNSSNENDFGSLWGNDMTNPGAHALFIKMTAEQIWRPRTRYYENTFFAKTSKLFSCPIVRPVDKSRDLIHPGIQAAETAAEEIIKGLNL